MSAWISAIRLRTLPLAAASILAGSFFAANGGNLDPTVFVLSLLTAFLLQILSNLANDYGDFSHGVDDGTRVGPQRAVQSGAISARSMFLAVLFTGSLSFASGLSLLYFAFYPDYLFELLIFLGLGIGSIIGAYRYTAGKNPYGYRAFGDLAVFVFFGLIGILGSYWLHAKAFSLDTLCAALGFGFLIVSVLNLNNLRDLEADKAAGKRTLAVILGPKRARSYQAFLFGLGVFLVSLSYLMAIGWSYALGAILIGMTFFRIMFRISTLQGAELDPYLKQVALSTLFLSVLPWANYLIP